VLNCLWIVTGFCKAHVNQRLFPFSYLSRKDKGFVLPRDYISENQYVKITSGYWFVRESWVIRTLLLSQGIESPKATRVPSPIISMTKRTALCLPMDPTRKQNTRVSLGNKPFSGLRTWQYKTRLRVTALRPLSVLCWTNQRYFDVYLTKYPAARFRLKVALEVTKSIRKQWIWTSQIHAAKRQHLPRTKPVYSLSMGQVRYEYEPQWLNHHSRTGGTIATYISPNGGVFYFKG